MQCEACRWGILLHRPHKALGSLGFSDRGGRSLRAHQFLVCISRQRAEPGDGTGGSSRATAEAVQAGACRQRLPAGRRLREVAADAHFSSSRLLIFLTTRDLPHSMDASRARMAPAVSPSSQRARSRPLRSASVALNSGETTQDIR